jgi:uncharacterized protein YkwD
LNNLSAKSKKIISIILIVVSVCICAYLFLSGKFDFSSRIKRIEVATSDFLVQALHTDSLTPPPLRSSLDSSKASLSNEGVFNETNQARISEGLQPLTFNTTLNKIAEQKLRDMFDKQYFEHISPSGKGASDLAKNAGYEYIIIGENLALGNFKDDKTLVDAWLASPGHRANILNNRYKEIGIAVGKDIYEGRTTWIAVQEFGLPISACPSPNPQTKVEIDADKKAIDALEITLSQKKSDIDSMNPQYGPAYNSKVEEYNELVRQYNAQVVALKAKIADYNREVGAFNSCAQVATTTPEQL